MNDRLDFFAACTPGLEPFTSQELETLGLEVGLFSPGRGSLELQDPAEHIVGGVSFSGSLTDLYRANLHLRTANRILVRFGTFQAASFQEFRRKAGQLPWEEVLGPGSPVAFRVTCHRSRLYHQKAVAERLAGAIADRLGQSPPVQPGEETEDTPGPQLIMARLVNNRVTISLDSSGPLLHRRGYRLAAGKAPLRETLAAGLLMASGWNKASPLVDPFCGSGTIPIEAALWAFDIPPGLNRPFAFINWPSFETQQWKALLTKAAQRITGVTPLFIASDRDQGAVRMARENAERAGVGHLIDFSCRAISSIEAPATPGWVVTNPPFGVRVSRQKDLRNLYAQFGQVLRIKCPGWQVALLCTNLQLARNIGLRLDQGIPLAHGGLKVRILRGRVGSA
jgi:putative N6-adenine-specific DNA methylase